MKRVIALLLALSLVFAFAACKKTDKEDETKAPETEIVTNEEGEEVVVPAEDETEAEAETNEDGETVEAATEAEDATEADTKADGKPDSKPDANKPAQKGLNSTNPAEVAAFYVKARNASLANPPKGHQTMKLASKMSAEGGLVGKVLPIANPIVDSALKKNSVETNFVPAGGYADLKGSDITSCSAKVQGNYTIVNIKLKDQVDGSNGNKTNGGAVSRGIGTLGSIDEALNELDGIELKSGRDTVKLTYTDAWFTAKIDNNTGKIVGGTYHYLVKIHIASAELHVKIMDVSLNNLRGSVDYTVKLGTDDK